MDPQTMTDCALQLLEKKGSTSDFGLPSHCPKDWLGVGPNSPVDRHCAYCLVPTPKTSAKICSKCHRRSYCSKECQAKDWKSKKDNGTKKGLGLGQGHQSWCGLPCGEEDLDWEVVEIPGKGEGLVAKRHIPANCRIIVEGIKGVDLLGNLANSYRSLQRSNLVNHACDANATKFFDPDFKTMVVYSKRDIQAGEEISVNYLCLNEFHMDTSHSTNPFNPGDRVPNTFAECRAMAKSKWGITCPPDCFCRNPKLEEEVTQGKEEYESILLDNPFKAGGPPYGRIDAVIDLQIVVELLQKQKRIKAALLQKAFILETGFKVGIQQEETMAKAREFAKEAHHIFASILHPQCRFSARTEKWVMDPKSCDKYLALKNQPLDNFGGEEFQAYKKKYGEMPQEDGINS